MTQHGWITQAMFRLQCLSETEGCIPIAVRTRDPARGHVRSTWPLYRLYTRLVPAYYLALIQSKPGCCRDTHCMTSWLILSTPACRHTTHFAREQSMRPDSSNEK